MSEYNYETVVIIHPLSFGRGGLLPYVIFLSEKGCRFSNFKKVSICATTADVLNWTYSNDSWGRARETVAFLCYLTCPPDDVIGNYTAKMCKDSTLKGYFYNSNLSKHDSLVEYSRTESKTLLYKEMFLL